MGNSHRTVQCASADCERTFKCRARTSVHYCPACRIKRLRESKRRFKRIKRQVEYEPVYDPDAELNEKLAAAEFTILRDAGPQELAFRRGAKVSAWEVHYMLKYNSIAEDSVLMHSRTGVLHRVILDLRGELRLEPPWVMVEQTW